MKKELLSPEELEMVKGGIGFDVRTYGWNVQGVYNCCNNQEPPPPPPVDPVDPK